MPVRQRLSVNQPLVPSRPLYARINISPKLTLYARFYGTEIRSATTVGGLTSARPIAGHKQKSGELAFPEIVVANPQPTQRQEPTAVRVRFGLVGSVRVGAGRAVAAGALFGLCRPDAQGSVWTCWFSLAVPLGNSLEHCRGLDLPDLADLKLDVVTKAEGRKVGVGVRVMAGDALVAGIHRDDKRVEAHVVVRAPDGHIIVSESGPLSKFGFG
jgi:hypothetical protein